MAKENAILNTNEKLNEDFTESFDFDELEEKLQNQLEEELVDMQFLAEEKEKIGNPDNLGNVVMDVVWEQFLNQIAVTAGEDFIKENRGLHLDLRKEAHIQTTENFAEGKIATHNTEIDYQKRYDEWQANFQRNEDGSIRKRKDQRTGKMKEVLRVRDRKKDPSGENYNTNYNAREPFDKNRPKGSAQTNIDEIISVAEQLRDPEANAHLTKDEIVAFDNSDINLNPMDAAANQSKGDSTMTEFLESERDGKKPAERFNINEEELRKKDAKARKEYEKRKKEGEQRSIEAGKNSRKKEAFRVGGMVLRAVLMQLLAELIREIIAKLVKWFKSAKKTLNTLLDSLKEAIHSFIGKMKTHLINAGDVIFSTVATTIIGPIFGTIKKVWMMLKQGWSSLKNAVNYIKDPANKNKPVSILLMEVGKIIIAGMTGVGALFLGEVIEKGLMTIPIFAVEIPLLGSLANILGIFFGAVVAGIIGAIAINLIERQIKKSMKRDNINAQIKKGNKILNLQHQVQVVNEVKLERTKTTIAHDIYNRHIAAANEMKSSIKNIKENCIIDKSIQDTFDDIDALFDELGD